MGLFQVVNVSVKKGTVLSTFKRTTPFAIAFSWTHLCARVETKQKQSSASWCPGAILQCLSSSPRDIQLSLSQHRCGFTLGLRWSPILCLQPVHLPYCLR